TDPAAGASTGVVSPGATATDPATAAVPSTAVGGFTVREAGPGGPVPAGAAPVAAAAVAAPTRPTVDVTCPGCGTVSRFDRMGRTAEAFCRHCDYPLFWARSAAAAFDSEPAGQGLRRLPGTAGRQAELAVECRVCREPNRASAVVCIRCGAEMNPAPAPAPEPVVVAPPPPAPVPVPEPEPEPTRWWPWVVALAVLALVVLLALLLTG
ncbi:MAG: hypothetical protein AB7L84_14280, partial [Acidimicrobiia bacterium]